MLDAMGLAAFAERARRELAATGETVRARTVDTVTALTAQEAYIVRLACVGCTNAEIGGQLFLSVRTVEWHLRQGLHQARRRLPPRAAHRAGQTRAGPPGGLGRALDVVMPGYGCCRRSPARRTR